MRLLCGDARAQLASLDEKSVHMCVTSPPFYGLRSYSTEPQLWGGNQSCEHNWQTVHPPGWRASDTHPGPLQHEGNIGRDKIYSSTCSRCGGWRGELGSEQNPESFVTHLVEVFQAVRRVLRDDGLLFVNLANSYWGGKGKSGYELPHEAEERRAAGETLQHGYNVPGYVDMRPSDGKHPIYKSLDLIDVCAMFSLAMVQDGWYHRSTITLVKQSPMPESVAGWSWQKHRVKIKSADIDWRAEARKTDRPVDGAVTHVAGGNTGFRHKPEWRDCPGCQKCLPNDGLVLRKGSWRPTNAYELIFMFAKTADYYASGEDVRTEHTQSAIERTKYRRALDNKGRPIGNARDDGGKEHAAGLNALPSTLNPAGANMRNWVTLRRQNLSEPHYAAYPISLPAMCIKIGTSAKGVCAACGAPYARVVRRPESPHNGETESAYPDGSTAKRLALLRQAARENGAEYQNETQTLGWRQSCKCKDAGEPVKATVLDPFVGSGTTLLAAIGLGRDGIGIDLNEKYLDIARRRLGLFAGLAAQQERVDAGDRGRPLEEVAEELGI